MNGTVTISLENYETLKASVEKTERMQDNLRITIKELQVFLSFICTRSNLELYVEEYNKQATSSRIKLSGGKAVIERIDENKNKS
jgi:hypothetical protein|tara:strand:- start:11688 stop:11942 length:255 start_codon:yes stop_codon:yes gene_type:complete